MVKVHCGWGGAHLRYLAVKSAVGLVKPLRREIPHWRWWSGWGRSSRVCPSGDGRC